MTITDWLLNSPVPSPRRDASSSQPKADHPDSQKENNNNSRRMPLRKTPAAANTPSRAPSRPNPSFSVPGVTEILPPTPQEERKPRKKRMRRSKGAPNHRSNAHNSSRSPSSNLAPVQPTADSKPADTTAGAHAVKNSPSSIPTIRPRLKKRIFGAKYVSASSKKEAAEPSSTQPTVASSQRLSQCQLQQEKEMDLLKTPSSRV